MNLSNRPANPLTVREYLTCAYLDVSEERARELVDEHHEDVETAMRLGSYAYFPGDKIAAAAGLTEDPDYTDEEEDA